MSKFNLKTVDLSNAKTDSISLDVENIDILSPRSLAYTVSWQLSRRRSGSAKTKTMAEISGTTAKPHKQKGTGSARQGSKRSVQFRGGRTCFGPIPRSFNYTLNKKIIQLAVADAIRLKIKENQVILFKENYDQAFSQSYLTEKSKIGDLARYSLIIRDRIIITNIYKALQKYDRVFIVFGGFHLLTQKPSLDKMFAK